MSVVALRDAGDVAAYGGKASSLARAIGASLPAPDGFALSWDLVNRIVTGDAEAIAETSAAFRALGASVAARSSAIGEDSIDASFAGQHVSILNVTTDALLFDAVRTIHASAHAESALAYRRKMGVQGEPRIAVVVQRMIDSDVAGVLFTRNPMTGADERVIESSWGLGEAVVSGLVTPDRFRIARGGEVLERTAGRKDFMIRFAEEGGTIERPVRPEDILRLSLDDAQLAELHELASKCEQHFGGPQDIEWAFHRGTLVLLQSRPVTTSVRAHDEEQPSGLSLRRFSGLALAALLAPLNSTIIAVALPSISTAFAATPATATLWLVTAYLVVTIVAQSPAGKLADLWGTSRVLTLGRAAFGIGALVAALSPSLPILGAGRVLMAIGGALAIPTVFAQLRNSVPAERRGRIFGIFGAIMGAAAATGPVLGGLLTSAYGWHSVFVVNVPVVLLSFLLEPPVRGPRAAKRPRFDWLGSVILGIAVVILVAAVHLTSILFAGVAIALLAVFVVRELRVDDPVLDVRLFTRAPFAAGSSIIGLQNLAMYAMLFLLPFFLADRGAARTGRTLLLFTLSMVLASPIGGRLTDAIGARIVAVAGALIAAAGAALFISQGELVASVILMGAGIGMSSAPAQASALGAVSASEAGVASGALSTMRYVGGVIGSGLVTMLAGGGLVRDARLFIFPAVLLVSAAAALVLPGRRGLKMSS
ncbi:MAG TPA: MFS transporter [Thermoanaerobaculia bacterium]|nr:MFS transporter [Thermoanaerobaculia bacterium]